MEEYDDYNEDDEDISDGEWFVPDNYHYDWTLELYIPNEPITE